MCRLTVLFSGWKFKKNIKKQFNWRFCFSFDEFFSSQSVTFADFDFYETSQLKILHIPQFIRNMQTEGFLSQCSNWNQRSWRKHEKRMETFTTFSQMWKLMSMAYIALSIVYIVDVICELFSFNFWTFGWNQMVNSCFNFIFISFIERWTILSLESC